MVLVAITANGLRDAVQLVKNTNHAVWCGSDAISEQEYEALQGRNLSRFEYPLGGKEFESLEGALATISEHHPLESIWVETLAK